MIHVFKRNNLYTSTLTLHICFSINLWLLQHLKRIWFGIIFKNIKEMEDVWIHNFHSPVFSSPEVRAQMSLNFDPPLLVAPPYPLRFLYILYRKLSWDRVDKWSSFNCPYFVNTVVFIYMTYILYSCYTWCLLHDSNWP